jgi:hypothetical protein
MKAQRVAEFSRRMPSRASEGLMAAKQAAESDGHPTNVMSMDFRSLPALIRDLPSAMLMSQSLLGAACSNSPLRYRCFEDDEKYLPSRQQSHPDPQPGDPVTDMLATMTSAGSCHTRFRVRSKKRRLPRQTRPAPNPKVREIPPTMTGPVRFPYVVAKTQAPKSRFPSKHDRRNPVSLYHGSVHQATRLVVL